MTTTSPAHPARPRPRPPGRRHTPRPRHLVWVAGLALAAAACAGTSSSPAAAPASTSGTSATSSAPAAAAVLGTAKTSLGTILVDATGRTIYMFAADTPGHSACEGSCLQYWPVVRAPASLPASIPGVTAKVGVLDRPDGTKQLTVAGWPVYTFAGDSGPGATAGQGKNASGGLWWVLSPDGKIIKGSGSATTSAGTRGGYGGY